MRRWIFVGVAAILATSVLSPAALAGKQVTIDGGGWGHGIGMSQYGAYGLARKGKGARRIVEKYYTGARVMRRKMPRRIRVGLLQGRSSISTSSSAYADGKGRVVWRVAGNPRTIARGGAAARWTVEPSPTGSMRLYKNGARVEAGGSRLFGSPDRPLILKYEPFDTLVRVAEKNNAFAYGRMEFATYSSSSCGTYCLNLVVRLPMQKYLYGLGEVPASWPQAALRAQAIAGRTYAYEKVLRLGQRRYPCSCAVYDSVIDQAYIGDAKRTGSGAYWDDWTAAVDATRGKVVLYGGTPIQALYSSSSGGHTENNENVWGGAPIAYLRGVRDRADAVSANPHHKWSVTLSWRSFSSKLAAAFGTGRLRRFRLIRPFGVSGRVTVVKSPSEGGAKIVGEAKTVRADGWEVRTALGLKDTLFRVSVAYVAARPMRSAWSDLGGAPGFATGPAYRVPGGGDTTARAQDFTTGRMWAVGGRTLWQHGPVLRRYDEAGGERSRLGLPRSSVWAGEGYEGAAYERGIIVYSEETGAHVVRGRFLRALRSAGGVRGSLGLPTGERRRSPLAPDKVVQRFVGGTVYRVEEGAIALWGEIDRTYRAQGGAASICGAPLWQRGHRAAFEGGEMTVHGNDVAVSCA